MMLHWKFAVLYVIKPAQLRFIDYQVTNNVSVKTTQYTDTEASLWDSVAAVSLSKYLMWRTV